MFPLHVNYGLIQFHLMDFRLKVTLKHLIQVLAQFQSWEINEI